MGIEGLWNCLKKYPYIFKLVPFRALCGYRIFVDCGSYFFRLRAGARENVIYRKNILVDGFEETDADEMWMKLIFDTLVIFLAHGIIPVYVFDGEASFLKRGEREKRVNEKAGIRAELMGILSNLGITLDGTSIKPLSDTETKSDLAFARSSNGAENGRGPGEMAGMGREVGRRVDPFSIPTETLKRVRELLTQLPSVPKESVDMVKMFLSSMGVPVIQAIGEAERVCAALCNAGYGFCFTPDGDALAHHSRILLKSVSDHTVEINGLMCKCFEMVEFRDVLTMLDTNEQRFTEACVLGGCDYNSTSRLDRVAFGTALDMIKKAGDIERLSMQRDISCINHRACLNEFTQLPLIQLIADIAPEGILESGMIDIRPWSQETGDRMRMFRMDSYVSQIKHLLSTLPSRAANFKHKSLVVGDNSPFDILSPTFPIPNEKPVKKKYNGKKKAPTRSTPSAMYFPPTTQYRPPQSSHFPVQSSPPPPTFIIQPTTLPIFNITQSSTNAQQCVPGNIYPTPFQPVAQSPLLKFNIIS